MKKLSLLKLSAITFLFGGLVLLAHAGSYLCSQDGSLLFWTGNHKIDSRAQMLYEYKCLNGHIFWLNVRDYPP